MLAKHILATDLWPPYNERKSPGAGPWTVEFPVGE